MSAPQNSINMGLLKVKKYKRTYSNLWVTKVHNLKFAKVIQSDPRENPKVHVLFNSSSELPVLESYLLENKIQLFKCKNLINDIIVFSAI